MNDGTVAIPKGQEPYTLEWEFQADATTSSDQWMFELQDDTANRMLQWSIHAMNSQPRMGGSSQRCTSGNTGGCGHVIGDDATKTVTGNPDEEHSLLVYFQGNDVTGQHPTLTGWAGAVGTIQNNQYYRVRVEFDGDHIRFYGAPVTSALDG